MRIHDTKLQCEIENQPVLMQEHICYIFRGSIIMPNSMQRMR